MSARLPVLFLGDHLVTGGAERHAVSLANGLDRARFAVSFGTLKAGGASEKLLQHERLERFFCASLARKLDFDAARRIGGQLDELGCEAIVATNPYATLYAVLGARRAARAPAVISTFHSTLMPGLKNQIQMLFYRGLFPLCDALVYVSSNQRDYWARRGLWARRVEVIHNGIDVQHFGIAASSAEITATRARFGFPREALLVGICAAMRPEKAHVDFVQGIARLRERGVDARGLIIGDGVERARVEAEIARLGLGAVIAISGYVLDPRPLILACDALALTSHGVETFSLSALEAMALGRPMVMTDIGGASEQVEHGVTGFLYRPGDIAALAAALERLADPSLRQRFAALARAKVRERFEIGRMLRRYEQLIRETSEQRRGGTLSAQRRAAAPP